MDEDSQASKAIDRYLKDGLPSRQLHSKHCGKVVFSSPSVTNYKGSNPLKTGYTLYFINKWSLALQMCLKYSKMYGKEK